MDDSPPEQERRRTPWGLALFWVGAGVNHFRAPRFYEPIVPPPLQSQARAVVRLSGVAEILAGAAVIAPATRRVSGPYIVALLAAIFPANIYMALKPARFSSIPRWALFARLPLQPLMMVWAWRATRS
ncbi:MAG TPA: hypothetical protein VMA83_03655 [Solirubrobacteraceae bacterium]|nr:hypothetical protein [Solirubrobacteraceae bacterium]